MGRAVGHISGTVDDGAGVRGRHGAGGPRVRRLLRVVTSAGVNPVPVIVLIVVAVVHVNTVVRGVVHVGAVLRGRLLGAHAPGEVDADGKVDLHIQEVADRDISLEVDVGVEESLGSNGNGREREKGGLHGDDVSRIYERQLNLVEEMEREDRSRAQRNECISEWRRVDTVEGRIIGIYSGKQRRFK